MWKLVKEDGSVFRDGFPTQWEALISAKKADGTRYKKKEALQVQSGTRVYKEKYINTSILGQNVYEDGKIAISFGGILDFSAALFGERFYFCRLCKTKTLFNLTKTKGRYCI